MSQLIKIGLELFYSSTALKNSLIKQKLLSFVLVDHFLFYWLFEINSTEKRSSCTKNNNQTEINIFFKIMPTISKSKFSRFLTKKQEQEQKASDYEISQSNRIFDCA